MNTASPGFACATLHRRRQISYGVWCLYVHVFMQIVFLEVCKYIRGLQSHVQLQSSPDVTTLLFFSLIAVSKGLNF